MKTSLFRSLVSMAVACWVLLLGLNLLADPVPPAGLLSQAYATLAQADHDYKGHRVAAMKQIEAAGKALGVNIRGDGKGHEPQGVSDAQLRAAQGLLEQARAGLTGKPLKHINRALDQISIALTIK
jgi:hypothetical protein